MVRLTVGGGSCGQPIHGLPPALFAGIVPPRGGSQVGLIADPWPDDVPVPTFGPRMVCTRCGIIGADARPNWQEQPPRETLTGVQWR
jgi:hypothetical protein